MGPTTFSRFSRPPKEVTLKVQYIHAIQSGAKTVEGRINTGMFSRFKVGDHVRFFYPQDKTDDVICEIVQARHFSNFRDMLETVGIEKCLPEITHLDDGVRIYNNIPGYADKARRYGVIAFFLRKIAPASKQRHPDEYPCRDHYPRPPQFHFEDPRRYADQRQYEDREDKTRRSFSDAKHTHEPNERASSTRSSSDRSVEVKDREDAYRRRSPPGPIDERRESIPYLSERQAAEPSSRDTRKRHRSEEDEISESTRKRPRVDPEPEIKKDDRG